MRSFANESIHIRESMVGEEDPGAALDVVRAMAAAPRQRKADRDPARLHVVCREGARSIRIGVTWPHHSSSDTAALLGLVVAHHGAIADTAWSVSGATGRSDVELEVDEDTDGVFYVSRRDV